MLSTIAVLTFVVPLISALSLNVPKTTPTSGGETTITWSTSAGDPASFTLELLNTAFHDSFAISNNLVPAAGSVTLQLPIVPAADGYTLEAVQIGNITNVYSTSGSFSIGPQSSSTSTSSSTSSSSGTGKSSSTPNATPATTSAFGVTATPSSSANTITPAGSGTGTTPSAAAAATSTSANFNAASSLNFGSNTGTMAVLLLSAIAGAAFVAL